MQTTYAFGDFELDPARRLLTRDAGEPVSIGAKAFDALVCLVEHAGAVVTRDMLSSAVWPTTVVEDNNLSQTIQALRRALRDAGPEHHYVVTVPRRGYQFIAEVIATHTRPAFPGRRARWLRRAHPAVLIAAGTSVAVNLMLLAAFASWSAHRTDEPPLRADAASARVPAPVESAKWPLQRDKRELSAI